MSSTKRDIALLIVRLIIGGIFIFAGWNKIADMSQTVGFFTSFGIPAFLAYVVGYCEFIGGIMLVLGTWTCLASAVLAIIMIVATILTISSPMFMTPLATLAGTIAILGAGAGRFAVPTKRKVAQPVAPLQ